MLFFLDRIYRIDRIFPAAPDWVSCGLSVMPDVVLQVKIAILRLSNAELRSLLLDRIYRMDRIRPASPETPAVHML